MHSSFSVLLDIDMFFLLLFSAFLMSSKCVFPVTCALSPPTIVSNEEEFILQPNSLFNISCTGKRNVVWVEPLPQNTFVLPGYYTATLFIYNATVEHTRYYMCAYENHGTEAQSGSDEEETGIYVFVPGELCYIHTVTSWVCRAGKLASSHAEIWVSAAGRPEMY